MYRSRWLLLAIVLFLVWQGWSRHDATIAAGAETGATLPGSGASGPRTDKPKNTPQPLASAPAASMAATDHGLPPEARDTLRLILRGGPFPYDRDGAVFGNFEKLLPGKARGYYREYTVATAGLRHRGARRIVTGGKPPAVFYYTDDHYQSFREIEGQP